MHKLEKRVKSRLKEYRHPKINDDAVLEILDHVSGAKVEARLTVKREFGDRAAYHKEAAAEKKTAINRAIRNDQKSVRGGGNNNRNGGGKGAAKHTPKRAAAQESRASPAAPTTTPKRTTAKKDSASGSSSTPGSTGKKVAAKKTAPRKSK